MEEAHRLCQANHGEVRPLHAQRWPQKTQALEATPLDCGWIHPGFDRRLQLGEESLSLELNRSRVCLWVWPPGTGNEAHTTVLMCVWAAGMQRTQTGLGAFARWFYLPGAASARPFSADTPPRGLSLREPLTLKGLLVLALLHLLHGTSRPPVHLVCCGPAGSLSALRAGASLSQGVCIPEPDMCLAQGARGPANTG